MPRSPRIRILVFLFAAILILGGSYLLTAISNTLQRLTVVEAERDQWQRPQDVLRSLGVGDRAAVVDLGSGAGYFTLKLSELVGRPGEVNAVDLRRLSLFFLRTRAFLRGAHNIEITAGDPNDPHLPPKHADAVLISNTYHEFDDPALMLDRTYRSLKPGGRVVIVDRDLRGSGHGHEISSGRIEDELRRHGFEMVSRDDRFIDRPGDEVWWLVVAKRPQ